MSLSASLSISLSVVAVGLLMVLESFVIVRSKGVDVNGELPFVAFGTLFCAGLPAVLNLIGPWNKSWYWYLFIAFIIFSGFLSYIRSRGFTIRIFSGQMKNTVIGVEKALKQSGVTYEKTASNDGKIATYSLGNPKFPVVVTEKPQSALNEAHIEIVASEALWNKELHAHLMSLVANARKGHTTGKTLKKINVRLFVGVATVFLGAYLYLYAGSLSF